MHIEGAAAPHGPAAARFAPGARRSLLTFASGAVLSLAACSGTSGSVTGEQTTAGTGMTSSAAGASSGASLASSTAASSSTAGTTTGVAGGAGGGTSATSAGTTRGGTSSGGSSGEMSGTGSTGRETTGTTSSSGHGTTGSTGAGATSSRGTSSGNTSSGSGKGSSASGGTTSSGSTSGGGTCPPTATTSLPDDTVYQVGPYTGFLAPYGGAGYTFTESANVCPPSFPNNTEFLWSWPATTASGVHNFIAIDYGDYDDTTAKTPITPVQLSGLTVLTETHDLTFTGELQNFDVIDDGFFTTAPNGSTKIAEFEIFLHTPAYAASFVLGAKQLGTFTDSSGVAWTVANGTGSFGEDLLFMPTTQADIPKATIDLKAMFDFLINNGTLTGAEWFSGFATGTEVHEGSGSTTFNAYSVSYQ